MFGYTDRIRGDRGTKPGPGDHKGPGDRGPGDHKGRPYHGRMGRASHFRFMRWHVYSVSCLFRFGPYEFPAGRFGVSARTDQDEHKTSPLLWTIVLGGPLWFLR